MVLHPVVCSDVGAENQTATQCYQPLFDSTNLQSRKAPAGILAETFHRWARYPVPFELEQIGLDVTSAPRRKSSEARRWYEVAGMRTPEGHPDGNLLLDERGRLAMKSGQNDP